MSHPPSNIGTIYVVASALPSNEVANRALEDSATKLYFSNLSSKLVLGGNYSKAFAERLEDWDILRNKTHVLDPLLDMRQGIAHLGAVVESYSRGRNIALVAEPSLLRLYQKSAEEILGSKFKVIAYGTPSSLAAQGASYVANGVKDAVSAIGSLRGRRIRRPQPVMVSDLDDKILPLPAA